LDHNKLTGTIPSSLGSLPLQDLTLSYNSLTGKLPPSLAVVANTGRVVDISYNKLHGEIPVELCLARNMFLINNSVVNRCSDICRDKRYRAGNIHIASKEEKETKDEMRAQLAEEVTREEAEQELKELESFKKSLKNFINL